MPAVPVYPVLLLATFVAAQESPRTIATYTWQGREAAISSDDVALEMAPRHRRTQRGEETIAHLIDLHLVRQAAKEAKVEPGAKEVAAQLAEYRKAIEAQGRDPDEFLDSKGVTEAELAEYTELALALDRLVMRQLRLSDRGAVTNEYRELWLKDARKAGAVSTVEADLPKGIVARAGGRQFTLLDLGRVLYARAKPAERQRFARQIALRRILEAEAKRLELTVTQAECEVAVARIRERAEADKGGAVAFKDMLEAFGTTPDELADSPVLRAQVIARHLLAARHTEADVQERLEQPDGEVHARYGARRHIEVLWLRASDAPNQLVPRSFEAALEEAAGLRGKLGDGKTTFAMLARVHSDDPRTKLKGGDAGWHHGKGRGLPQQVLDWAFAAKQGDVSPPIRVVDGVCLARLAGVEPPPPLAVVRARMLDDMEEEFYRELLEASGFAMREGA